MLVWLSSHSVVLGLFVHVEDHILYTSHSLQHAHSYRKKGKWREVRLKVEVCLAVAHAKLCLSDLEILEWVNHFICSSLISANSSCHAVGQRGVSRGQRRE